MSQAMEGTEEFKIPLHFEDVESQKVVDLDTVAKRNAASIFEGCQGGRWWSGMDRRAFSEMYWLVKTFEDARGELKMRLVEEIARGAEAAVAEGSLTAVKTVGYLCAFLINIAQDANNGEKNETGGRGKSSKWSWSSYGVEMIMRSLAHVAEEQEIWAKERNPEDFASMAWRASLEVMENVQAMKGGAAGNVFKTISITLSRWGQAIPISAALVHMVHRHEHAAGAVAMLLTSVEQKLKSEEFVDMTIAELCASAYVSDITRDSMAAKFLGNTFARIGQIDSRVIARIAREHLVPLLNQDPYTLRNGVVDALASILRMKNEELEASHEGLRDEVVSLLLDRILDVNAFARSRVLQAWNSMVEEHLLKADELSLLAKLASDRLQDKAAAVRKSALQLWSTLMAHNPFSPVLGEAAIKAATEKLRRDSEEEERADSTDEDRLKKDQKKPFLEAFLSFTESNSAAVNYARRLLRSESITDVVEAINMLSCARSFLVEAAKETSRAILPLILARDNAASDAARRAVEQQLLIDIDASNRGTKEAAISLMRNLAVLLRNATIGERVCLEKLIESLSAGDSDIGKLLTSAAFSQVLWDVIGGRVGGSRFETRRIACTIVGVLNQQEKDTTYTALTGSKLESLTEVALQVNDYALSREACSVLSHIIPRQHPGANAIAEALSTKLLTFSDSCLNEDADNDLWLPLAEQAMNAVYALSGEPEVLAAKAIDSWGRKVLEQPKGWILSRLVFLVGHAAVKQLVFNEEAARTLAKAASSQRLNPSSSMAEDSLNEVVGSSTTADMDAAVMHGEEELVGSQSLLGTYAPVVAHVAGNRAGTVGQRTAAASALAKLMAVHSSVCQRYVQLLFSLLESRNAPPVVRGNTVIALGDLSFRHPNILEPWSPRLYACLRDDDANVRRHTISTLTHLILNDMIKVRGQIVELVLSLKDTDERVEALARTFFYELSRKGGNLIYNILPDTVSCLSQRNDVNRALYQDAMRFLISFLDKSRHAEGLVEKLCPRFRATDKIQDWRDLSFVLSLLPYQERSLRRLKENIRSYANALDDEQVLKNFQAVLAKAKHERKIDRELIAEMEETLRAITDRQDQELQDVLRNMELGSATPKSRTPRSVMKGGSRTMNSRKTTTAKKGTTATRQRSSRLKPLPLRPTILNSDDESD